MIMIMACRVTVRTLVLCCAVHLCHVSLACVFMLNGWTPLSVYERSALADIVAGGEVLRTFKHQRTKHSTYTAEVRFFTVHKGQQLFRQVQQQRWLNSPPSSSSSSSSSSYSASSSSSSSSKSRPRSKGGLASGHRRRRQRRQHHHHQHLLQHGSSGRLVDPMVFNVSNFGDKGMCYADVMRGELYVFFLTLFNGRLSAKYDDIFGAVAPYTKANEKQVLDYLGWHPWSPWGQCSRTCGDGQQSRVRKCSRDNVSSCEGSETDTRHCNTFSCADVLDLMTLFGIPSLPLGVAASEDRQNAYVINSSAKLFLPVSNVYDVTFPRDFSLLMTTRRKAKQEGYLLALSDISGRQRFAVYLGHKLRVEYMDNPNKKTSVLRFDVPVRKDLWHHIAVRVHGRQVRVYFNCDRVMEAKLRRGSNVLGTNLVLSLGPFFAKYGSAFEGELEQLVLSEDPSVAERQCYFQSGDHLGPVKDDSSSGGSHGNSDDHKTTRTPPKNVTKSTPVPALVYAEWSPWSACSATCGQGRQSRSIACTHQTSSSAVVRSLRVAPKEHGGGRSGRGGNCIPNDTPRVQVRSCWVLQKCAVSCPQPCQNGGSCMDNGQCRCPPGYHGNFCQSALCTPGCQNGGQCVSPGHCQCPPNYTGNSCETPDCTPPCLNGGRCTSNARCSCPYGYTGPDCQPYCGKACHNGGQCVRHDRCRCAKGYTGRYCQTPVCRRGCSNGGKCVAPRRCSCPSGYGGRRCQKPRCRPGCKNGGKCIAPDVCLCGPGLVGPRCHKYKCKRKCRNGGKCMADGKCRCPADFSGRYCQKAKCNLTCLNGGRCRRHKNRCRCPKGFRGRRCEKRACVYEQYTVPYRKTYRRSVREEVLTSCGPWSWKSCVRTVIKYVTVSKDATRTAYRCV